MEAGFALDRRRIADVQIMLLDGISEITQLLNFR